MLIKSLLSLALIMVNVSVNAVNQNSKEARQFFKNRLEFLTNTYAVKQVAEGKVHDAVIIDVRAAEDYKQGHIPNAINLPYDQYQGFLGDDTSFPGLSKEKYNYVYCYTDTCNLAAKAAVKFASLGYAVKEMQGGFETWENEGKLVIQ